MKPEKLKINVDGRIKAIEYDIRYSKGIFIATENKLVKKNCKELSIALEPATNELELMQRVTKLGRTGILTTRTLGVYRQYFIQDYAELDDVNSLISESPSQMHEPLRSAYNLTKLNNLDDLDLLGSPLDNKN